jgi:hypothetical protein
VPAGVAEPFGSLVFFGTLLALIVGVVMRIPR